MDYDIQLKRCIAKVPSVSTSPFCNGFTLYVCAEYIVTSNEDLFPMLSPNLCVVRFFSNVETNLGISLSTSFP
jgi:hypothetical protein